jgi:hypothetical protein
MSMKPNLAEAAREINRQIEQAATWAIMSSCTLYI